MYQALATKGTAIMTHPPVLSADEAMASLAKEVRVVAGPGCGTPVTLLRALGRAALERDLAPHLRSGLLLDYPFLDAVATGHMRYDTWHVMGEVRAQVEQGLAGYLPVRASAVPGLLRNWTPDVTLVRVSPPDRHGYCSLGPSASYTLPAVMTAPIVIGELDERLPRTLGQSSFHVSRLSALVPSEDPTPEYPGARLDDVSRKIAATVLELVPRQVTLQVGIGAVPEALVHALESGRGWSLRFVGMGCDAMIPLFENGAISPDAILPRPGIYAAELMGSRTLMEYADRHPGIGVFPSTSSHDAPHLGSLGNFVSINSALEVDLWGQVNAEVAQGRQLAGVGGSTDYFEAAYNSDGGRRIIALPATTSRGASRIVAKLGADSVVTVPRQMADVVVTEYGAAELAGCTLVERAERLVAIADPTARDQLADSLPRLLADTART